MSEYDIQISSSEETKAVREDDRALLIGKKVLNARKKTKLFLVYILICVGCFLLGMLTYHVILDQSSKPTPPKETFTVVDPQVSVDTVKQILEPAGELVSGKYRYKNVMNFREAKELDLKINNKKITLPGTTDEYYIEYDGTINAGYKLSEAKLAVDNDNKLISIQMPEMQVLSSEINWDNIVVRAINDSVFNNTDVKGSVEAQKKADDYMRKSVSEDNEFKTITENSARNVLKAFLTASGDTKEYKVEVTFGGANNE